LHFSAASNFPTCPSRERRIGSDGMLVASASQRGVGLSGADQ
jgi:hypothetical protein